MHLNLGMKIRELRRRDSRTQEALADALGVTPQAVSRWEQGGSYPDMELLPAIANYFGVTIDELFGYHSDRENRVEGIIRLIDSCNIKARGDDDWVDDCLTLLREGLAEFPNNERLLITLADTLSEAGWRRHQEWLYYDEEGYIQHRYDVHQKNLYWAEAVKICEQQADANRDAAEAESERQTRTAEANRDANKEKKDAQYEVERTKCEAMSGDAQDRCLADVDRRFDR